jgi:hypothetical protein
MTANDLGSSIVPDDGMATTELHQARMVVARAH